MKGPVSIVITWLRTSLSSGENSSGIQVSAWNLPFDLFQEHRMEAILCLLQPFPAVSRKLRQSRQQEGGRGRGSGSPYK